MIFPESKYSKGFTLIELLVTVAVVAIVLGLAVPSFRQQVVNNKSLALGDEFLQALNYARSEAVKSKKRVSLCASANGETCSDDWSKGFIVFQDDAASDVESTITLGSVYKIWPKLSSDGSVSVKRGADATNFIRYTSLGTLAPIDDKTISIDIKLTGCTGKAARTISVNLSGFASVKPDEC
jgi:type IV fimbrial biogenesis protein FimT